MRNCQADVINVIAIIILLEEGCPFVNLKRQKVSSHFKSTHVIIKFVISNDKRSLIR